MPTENTALLDAEAGPDVPPNEMRKLLKETNFTEREIESYYKNAITEGGSDLVLSRSEFAKLCYDSGIRGAGMIERMWDFMDKNNDGHVSPYELVKGLSPLLRGTREEVAGFFFDLYEVDGDGELSAAEIISVYSDMIHVSKSDPGVGLTSAQKERIVGWVDEQRELNKDRGGKLDKDAFVQSVRSMADEIGDKPPSLYSPRSLLFLFLTMWFEVGTSYTYFAVGALADRFKERYDITDAGIGQLTSAYFIAAIIGPFIAGVAMDSLGPGPVNMGATFIVFLGAVAQAYSDGPDMYWLLVVGRLLVGFGGDAAPFLTVEMLGRIFPDYLGLMAGIRNLVQSTNGFLSFILLPMWAANHSQVTDNAGTTFALWVCAVLSFLSFAAVSLCVFMLHQEKSAAAAAKAEAQADQAAIMKNIRALTRATTPEIPSDWTRWLLPVSFYFAAVGIQAQYFCALAFTSFSVQVYTNKFGTSASFASFATGLINLLAGLMGPIMGPLSDKYGKRAESLAFFSACAAVGFLVLAVGPSSEMTVWIATVLFAFQYGFGDTVSYVSIRFIVDPSRTGIGYGIYSVIGNLITTAVAIVAGIIIEGANGLTNLCWFFFGLLIFGVLSWVIVAVLEGSRSLLALPCEDIIETSDDDLRIAALTSVIGSNKTK
eukprot:CAMPEP_0118681368 /NCGR_PEP_ID=MMETSP0800-20121206/4898_1 /TAXON_ID=210618 ORGANISM="Striatella unipunctata, Strain CCMP2910" /NCGR_SAMPLE_ID=MMETSP0800 /ASSEMBLY_ACC=CAM_ASM_000638 /LENGTH=656 /DNA_ID=CAMNT_0006577653 /DNA_START=25 /DNA_END=1995 /DNA_ORIENTATION=-